MLRRRYSQSASLFTETGDHFSSDLILVFMKLMRHPSSVFGCINLEQESITSSPVPTPTASNTCPGALLLYGVCLPVDRETDAEEVEPEERRTRAKLQAQRTKVELGASEDYCGLSNPKASLIGHNVFLFLQHIHWSVGTGLWSQLHLLFCRLYVKG